MNFFIYNCFNWTTFYFILFNKWSGIFSIRSVYSGRSGLFRYAAVWMAHLWRSLCCCLTRSAVRSVGRCSAVAVLSCCSVRRRRFVVRRFFFPITLWAWEMVRRLAARSRTWFLRHWVRRQFLSCFREHCLSGTRVGSTGGSTGGGGLVLGCECVLCLLLPRLMVAGPARPPPLKVRGAVMRYRFIDLQKLVALDAGALYALPQPSVNPLPGYQTIFYWYRIGLSINGHTKANYLLLRSARLKLYATCSKFIYTE